MAKYRGTIRRSDLEGGVWTLVTDQGVTYELVGAAHELKDGARAEIEGSVEQGGMGLAMVGDILRVTSCRLLSK